MKKLLGIIVLGLILSGNVYASCTNEFDFKWRVKGDYAKFEFKSTSDKSIRLSSLSLKTSDSKIVKTLISDSNNFILKAFGARNESYYIGDINKDVVSSAAWSCKYYQKTIKKKSQPKALKRKKTKDNSSNLGVVALLVVAVFIAIWANGNSSPEKKSKSKKPTYRPTNNEEDNNSQLENASKPKIKVQKEDKTIAKFYNDYKSIDFTDSKSIMSKANKKQTETLVNIIMPCLQSLADKYPKDTQVVMILIKLVEDNLVSEEKFIEVQKNLKEMKNIGETVGLNQKLMTALHIMVG